MTAVVIVGSDPDKVEQLAQSPGRRRRRGHRRRQAVGLDGVRVVMIREIKNYLIQISLLLTLNSPSLTIHLALLSFISM